MAPTQTMRPSPALDRHEAWRAAREGPAAPTLSVLVGPIERSASIAREWADARGRPLLRSGAASGEGAVTDWLDGITNDPGLVDVAVEWVARARGEPEGPLRARLQCGSPFELGMVLDATPPEKIASTNGLTSRLVLESWLSQRPFDINGFYQRLDPYHVRSTAPGPTALIALDALCRAVRVAPVYFWAPPIEATRDGTVLRSALRDAAELVCREPLLTVCVALSGAARALHDDHEVPGSRIDLMVKHGTITDFGDEAPVPVHPSTAASEDLSATVQRLVPGADLMKVNEAARDAAQEAARIASRLERGQAVADDNARSAAERLLYAVLEAHPETAGRFRLNAALDFRFGPTRAMEVDLLASELALAVEIDGYFHFRDDEAYRRDRRKDLELQKRGYLVVRVLAADVVGQLEDVLSLILGAVAHQRARTDRFRGSTP